jgi:hypothetical protein
MCEGHQMEWFDNLDETDKKSLIELMSQALQQYGGFNKNVERDMKTKFELEDIKTQQLFAFLYEEPLAHDQVIS